MSLNYERIKKYPKLKKNQTFELSMTQFQKRADKKNCFFVRKNILLKWNVQ